MNFMANHYVHDYETLSNCFIAVFIHYITDETKVFVVHELRNDFQEFADFLEHNSKNNEWHISYNGLAFDSQITHYVLQHKETLKKHQGETIARLLYDYAQKTIDKQDRKLFSDYPSWKMSIKQIDLFKMNHWDNPAKSSSLKWIQYSMDWENVLEMPIHHSATITTIDEINEIISYCINDVKSTKQIMILGRDQIALRQALTKEYDIDLYSASEPRISKELFSYFLTRKLNWDKKDLREMRTRRNEIVLKDCILPQISFDTSTFQGVLDYFKSKIIVETKGALNYSIEHKGVITDYGLGGIHGAASPGIYEANKGWIIMTSDVTSFYPNLAIRNGFSPAHLPSEEFLDQYEWFFDERKKIPKKDPRNYVYKIILNSTYGLSNDENSFLYDPMFTMQITINGQLWLSKLYEMLSTRIPDSIPLMQNTDGLEMMIPEQHRDLYLEICKEWEQMTNLQLEHDEYSKLILRDVNNYIAVYKNGKTKCKGFFEFNDLALHKNKSFLVIPKAVYEYLVNGVKPEDYLEQNQNIYDYCGGVKAKSDWQVEYVTIEQGIPEKYKFYSIEKKREHLLANGWEMSWSDDNWVRSDAKNKEANTGVNTDTAFAAVIHKEAILKRHPLQKINRYYISHEGVKMIKRHKKDGREIQVEAGKWMQTICNNIKPYTKVPFKSLNINKQYYLERIYKEIENVTHVSKSGVIQGSLF